MNRLVRPCPICTAPLTDTPKWAIYGPKVNGERTFDQFFPIPGWSRWECVRCGTALWIRPFKHSKRAEQVGL